MTALTTYAFVSFAWGGLAFAGSEKHGLSEFFGAVVFGLVWPVVLWLVLWAFVLGKLAQGMNPADSPIHAEIESEAGP